MLRPNKLKNIISILVSKKNRVKNRCFQDNREKLDRRDIMGLEIVALISGVLI